MEHLRRVRIPEQAHKEIEDSITLDEETVARRTPVWMT